VGVYQRRLRFLTGLKKSTLSMRIKQMREMGWVKTRDVRIRRKTFSLVSIAFKKRFVVNLSKIESFQGVIERPALFIGTEPPTHVFGRVPVELENNIYIAVHIKDYMRDQGGQEARVLELFPKIQDIPPEQRSEKQSDRNFQFATTAKQYIENEGGQEDLVLKLISATKYPEEIGVEET